MTDVGKLFPMLGKDGDLMLGQGFFFLGEDGAEYSDTAMKFTGGITGTAVLKMTAEQYTLKAGSPEVSLDMYPIGYANSLEITFVEMLDLERLKKVIGYGSYTSTVADTAVAVVDEEVSLLDNYFYHTQGYRIAASPAPTVTSDDATPVSYTETTDGGETGDYEIDYDAGLLRRTPNTTIPNDSVVLFGYTYSKPAVQTLKFGSVARTGKYPLKFIVPNVDGYRFYIKAWKAIPQFEGTLTFDPKNPTFPKVTFEFMFDRRKKSDVGFFQMDTEKAPAV